MTGARPTISMRRAASGFDAFSCPSQVAAQAFSFGSTRVAACRARLSETAE